MPSRAQAYFKVWQRNTEELSTKCRIRHFVDYAEEKQMPKFLSILFLRKEMAAKTSA
jgi:hypothetical protein